MTPAEFKAASEPIRKQLQRIADALGVLAALATQPEPEQPTCPHPESQRLQVGQGPLWQCQACGEVVSPNPSCPDHSDPATMIRDRLRASSESRR